MQKITKALQRLLKDKNLYDGAIDGIMGPKTQAGMETFGVNQQWSEKRQMVACIQIILDAEGHQPGKIDGYWGHNTQNAMEAWDAEQRGAPIVLDRSPVNGKQPAQWPSYRNIESVFGKPGAAVCTAGKVVFPFAHKIDWNTSQKVSRFSCHQLAAPAFQTIFDEAAKHYGEAEYRRLRLDRFAGCYNARKMRGGSKWSTHSWGIAVDLDPGRNRLRWGEDRAAFAQDVYDPFWKIVESTGALSLGRVKDYDWMHFQLCGL